MSYTHNVAVGIIDEPTFVRKAEVLHQFLNERVSTFLSGSPPTVSEKPTVSVQLSFLMGYDTLERLFAPRYYQPINTDTISLAKKDAAKTAQVETMHAMLRSFFRGTSNGNVIK